MIPLACGVAILDAHTRLARLETDNTFLLAALGPLLWAVAAATSSQSSQRNKLVVFVGGGRNRYYHT
jgi:hypothetical protein